ncbi:dienelactone hydrolase family protein [Pusillimonas sp. SM2304]|uniref:alpha/beta hydrolase n=1 Tax=Pusillimonas sp. SM2304 TaxID=3073241 RepID=UPI002876B5E1|nr:dienelactone hydrolase family protein [Pusillimonas sp. SM2304]MDS1140378.1 dienelactone hydrolase family protein [Pusillimonas sp. SM2304]
MSSTALLECIEIETGPHPGRAVIWLHGLGADGNDFAPLVPELKLDGMPAIRFVFPHAPVRPVTINNGMSMRAWYDIFAPDLVRREDEPGLRLSQQAVQALIARENERGIPTDKIVLAGFSQGCAMTLQTGLRMDEKLAGLVGLSGYLPLAALAAAERHAANHDTPIFLAHGVMDPVVSLDRAEATRQALLDMGYPLTWKTYHMPHSVCLEEIEDIAAFLRRVLS